MRASRHRRNEIGASTAEYALLAALIAAVVVVAVALLGTSSSALFDRPCIEFAAASIPC